MDILEGVKFGKNPPKVVNGHDAMPSGSTRLFINEFHVADWIKLSRHCGDCDKVIVIELSMKRHSDDPLVTLSDAIHAFL